MMTHIQLGLTCCIHQEEAERVRKDMRRMKKEAPWLFNGVSNIGGIMSPPADSSFARGATGGLEKNGGGGETSGSLG